MMKTPVSKIKDDKDLQNELNRLYFKVFHKKCHINICNIYHHPTSAGVFLEPIKLPCIRINGSDVPKNSKSIITEISNAVIFFHLCFSKYSNYLLKYNNMYSNLAKEVANEKVFLYYSYRTGLYFFDKRLHTGNYTYNYDDKYVKVYYLGSCKAKNVDKTLQKLKPVYERIRDDKVSVIYNELSNCINRLPWCNN